MAIQIKDMRCKFVLGSAIALLAAPLAWAQPNAQSGWDEIAGDVFLQARVPTIIFHAVSSNGVGSALVLKKAYQTTHYTTEDGVEMLYGGTARVCEEYSHRGSRSDQVCLSWETVELHRTREFESRYCEPNTRTDGDCSVWRIQKANYPLSYEVPVYQRVSVSDSFSFGQPPAFTKLIEIGECREDCR